MNEVNDNGRLDQPLVRPPEEAASGEPQGVRPTDVEAKLIGVKGVIVGDHPWAGHTGEIVRIETTPWGRRPVVRLHDQCDHEVFLLSPRDWQPLTGTGHRRTVRPQVGLTLVITEHRRKDMKQIKKRKADASVNDVVIWDVHLFNGDWYYVFARSERQALRIVIDTHYEMRTREFRNQFAPKIRRIPDNEKILVNDEERGQQKWTAKRWAKGERPGPFCSNTYAW